MKTNDALKIIEIANRRDRKRFIRFQNRLYKGNKFFVPALETDEHKLFSPKNPSWDDVELKEFLAVRGKVIVGRIAVVIQKTYNRLHNCKNARFMRFDLIDDAEVSKALLDSACAFARERGMEVIHGPLGFNDLDKEGLLIEGFDKMSTFANFYNFDYYKTHLENYGFEKECDWLEFVVPMPKSINPTLIKVAQRMAERLGLSVVSHKTSKSQILKRYGKKIFDVINECYAGLHGVIPITEAVRNDILKQFKTILRREHVCIVVDKNDNVAGFGLAAPNISRSLNKSNGRLLNFGFLPLNALRIKMEARRPKVIDLLLVAVMPEYRGRGVNAIIISETFNNLVKTKAEFLESNLQMETNTAVQAQLDGYGKQLVKKRRCFKKAL